MPQLDPETGVAAPMCCDVAATSDFDVSADNATWYTGFALVRSTALFFRLRKGVAPKRLQSALESVA